MPYSKLLNRIIAEKNYSYADIIRECQKRGQKIDRTYLSKIVNGRILPPKEELSKVFAEICDVDERLLIVEGYLDRAPQIIRDVFIEMKKSAARISMGAFENEFEEKTLNELEKVLEKETLAEFVLSIIDYKKNDINEKIGFKINGEGYNIEMPEQIGIVMDSDAMSPIIPQNAKVILKIEDEYKNGDILVMKVNEKILIRKSFIYDEKVLLLPINMKYEMLTYDTKNIKVLGRVKKVVVDL